MNPRYWLLQACEKSSLLEQVGGAGDPPPVGLEVTPSNVCAAAAEVNARNKRAIRQIKTDCPKPKPQPSFLCRRPEH